MAVHIFKRIYSLSLVNLLKGVLLVLISDKGFLFSIAGYVYSTTKISLSNFAYMIMGPESWALAQNHGHLHRGDGGRVTPPRKFGGDVCGTLTSQKTAFVKTAGFQSCGRNAPLRC